MPRMIIVSIACLILAGSACGDSLEAGFKDPPPSAGVRCWWWWLNSNVTKEAITRDLEQMSSKGFAGAMIFDAGGANQRGNSQVPAGPAFASSRWCDLYTHALAEAERLGLELGLSIQSGWNLGGPNVTPDFAAKQLTFSEITIEGAIRYEGRLPLPKHTKSYYRDICLLAFPEKRDRRDLQNEDGDLSVSDKRRAIKDIALKACYRELGGSAPDCRFLLNDVPAQPGEEDARLFDILDISESLAPDGTLAWDVPDGTWTVLRFGYTITRAHVSTHSEGWGGHVIDYLSRDAFDRYWREVVVPLLEVAGERAGAVLKQLETDSWECGGMNWSPGFRDDFMKFRGYDPLPYLPVIAGRIIESRGVSNAFLADFRKTLGDCVANNHYRVFAEYAHRYGLKIQPESGGPHAGPLDAMKNLGLSDIVMGEFWAPSPHRPRPENRFFVKQASSVAHIYGKKYVAAEAFTTIGPHWNDVLWRSQRPSMDHELCSGLNMIFFHTFTCSPKAMGYPGQEYFAGTHVNPQVTWWDYSGGFIDYINRCQFLVQQGEFQADVLYYYGDHVPNLVRLKEADPARVLPGYDYDVTNEEILLELRVVDRSIVVPGGVEYRILVLPDHRVLSLAALEKVCELIRQGATVLGPKPNRLVSLVGGSKAQTRFKDLADELWGRIPPRSGQRKIGHGRLIWGTTAREVLTDDLIEPDFEYESRNRDAVVDYIHYAITGRDVYFVCNQRERSDDVLCRFRVAGKKPEIWDPVTGRIQNEVCFSATGVRTEIPLRFDPYGSCFVVFGDDSARADPVDATLNYKDYEPVLSLAGPWQVSFDPQWGGPAAEVVFEELTNWIEHPESGIRYYSGTAVYRTEFSFGDRGGGSDPVKEHVLDLGEVEDVGIARVVLNGTDLGVLWTKPFRVDITESLKPGANLLAIYVVNSWRNRLIGDRDRPHERRYTQTNITIRDDWKLLDSGLLGPVRILREL